MKLRHGLPLIGLLALPGSAVGAPAAAPGSADETPEVLRGVDLVDRAGERLPLDLVFQESTGRLTTLGELLEGRPAIVQLVYYGCPMLCTMVLNGFVEGARGVEWTPGQDYTVITVSFDPRDDVQKAALKKETYVAALGRPEAAAGWRFLVGDSAAVAALAQAVGFSYRWVPERQEFAHPAGMFVVTPEGTLSRTLYGISFEARDLKYSLTEASMGRLGSPLDKFLLYCFRYDAKAHTYALAARNIMKAGGILTVAALGGLLAVLWTRERRNRLAVGTR